MGNQRYLLGVFFSIVFFAPIAANAAITYQAPGALAYSASAGTSVSPAYPASIVAGELLILTIGMKPSTANGGSVTTPSGWTPITSLTGAGGYGTTLGADTGNTNVFTFYKVAVGGETGTLAVTIAGNGVSWAQMYRLSAAGGSTWNVAGATGSDTTGNTTVSIAMSTNPGVTANDFILGAMVIPTDVTTPAQFTAEALSQTGVTFGTVTEIGEPDSTTGNDIGGVTFRAPVSSGTGSANPTFTATAAGTVTNVRGPGVFIRVREVAASQTLTIGVTAGSKVTNLNSGDTSQYMQTTSCTSASTCAAFTLSLNTGSDTVTSIKLTETGTVNASTDLSNVALFYDTDGNYSNGVTGQYGSTVASFTSETATVSGSLAITSGTTYYFYVRSDIKSATPTYPTGGQTINFQIAATGDVTVSGASSKTGPPVSLAGTTTVRPQITSYTNSTESGLNYAGSCTGCGARLGGGSGFRQTVVISGFGFGSDPGLGSRDTSTNKVEVVGGATTILADDGSANTNVSAWSNTSITIRTDTTISGNADSDFGTNYGGGSALKVTAGSQAVPTNLNFYLFPQVTSVTTNTGVADGAREYDTGDTDGVITLNGTRFGSAQGTGYVRILGCDVSTCSGPTSSVTIDSWLNTAIAVRAPTIIADSTYTGSIAMQQGTGGNSKTHTYANTFRILPRITGFTPSSGSVGDAVTVDGNHFCQNGGTCPTIFGTNDKVTFNSGVDATVFTSWTNTAMATQVPTGATTGNVVLKSNTYDSNTKLFTVTSPTPNDPTTLNQYKNSGLTQAIAIGGSASSTPIYLTMTMQVGVSGGTLYPQIEHKPIGTAFTCSGTGACASATEGTGVAGPGPVDCSVSGNGCSISITPTENVHHWQARVRHNKNSVDYYSNWVSFGGNLESETDFKIDTAAPAITNVQSTNVQSNSATITWNTSGEPATSQVQYNTTGTFGACGSDCTTLDTNLVTSHSVNLSNLNSGTTYYYRVRSKDAAGNEAISSNSTFTTSSVTQPAKTTRFHIHGLSGSVSGGTATTTIFSVVMPETSPSVKSAFVEIRGVYDTNGSSPNGITVQVGSESAKTYALPGSADIDHLRILHSVSTIPVDPATTTLSITPQTNTTFYITSSDISVTYGYTP